MACVGQSDTGPSIDYPASDFLRILNVNIMGTYLVAQATAREMKAKGVDGAMVLVASMSGWVANKVSLIIPLSQDSEVYADAFFPGR